ncbi:MAG: hypothetical protein Q9199_002713 [Rusavskia elegans]
MPPLQPNNFTNISTTNILDVSRPGRRTRSRKPQNSNAPSPAQISTSNIIDAPNTPRKTRIDTIPASPVVRTTSTRQETRHDPITRKDRAARLQRTTRGRFAKTKPKSNAKETKRDAEDEEDTQDDDDPLSQIDDIRSKRASTKTLGESDGNATRTAYKDPTAHQMLKIHEEPITDVDMAVDRQENTRGIVVQQGDIADGTAATRTPYQGPTAHQMLKALEESIADAMDEELHPPDKPRLSQQPPPKANES